MVLTDREIQAAIDHKHIVIDPPPNELAYSSTSLDLALSKFIRIWKTPSVKGVEEIICPATEGYKFNDFAKAFSEIRELSSDGFVLDPKSFVLGWTEETVDLP